MPSWKGRVSFAGALGRRGRPGHKALLFAPWEISLLGAASRLWREGSMRELLEQYLKEGRDIHIHLSHDFHISGRITALGKGVVSLARGDALYHVPIDKIVYVFERRSSDSSPGG